jgi:dTDP-4-amino-4,6-dideoxygalactose transaminase
MGHYARKTERMKPIYVNHTWVPNREELYKIYDDIFERRELTNNKKYVQQLEQTLVAQGHSKYAFTTTNGTMALQIAIRALEIFNGEIITTPHSFIATAASIIWQNCTPVFVDIDPLSLCIDASQIEHKITPKTKAILAVHAYGNVCDIEAIEDIAARRGLHTIYDASHAFGVIYKGKSIFNFGSISTVSLHASKIVSAVEGGVVFCKNEIIARRIFQIRYFGKNADNDAELIGTNGKMSELNAGFGLLSLANLSKEIAARNKQAAYYKEALKAYPHLLQIVYRHDTTTNNAYYPIVVPSEKKLFSLIEFAASKNVFLRRVLYPSLNTLPFLNPSDTPVSESISPRIFCIPIYEGLSIQDQDRVIEVVTND